MSYFNVFSMRNFTITAALCLMLFISLAVDAQESKQEQSSGQGDEVLRINTDLVQTDVMVFDKQGRFVDNLKREQFDLRVDNKPQPISFFDSVATGSADEESKLAAARGGARPSIPKESPTALQDRGRSLFFFVDDVHLDADSFMRTRKLLLNFVDNEMGQNDQAAIVSTRSAPGFLQQLTNNKEVLHAAINRLSYHLNMLSDGQRPPMSEFQALAIEHNDRDALSYFVDEQAKEMGSRPQPVSAVGGRGAGPAEDMVRARASAILEQAISITTDTLATLESLVHSSSQVPGRKLAFFLSDGFFLDMDRSDVIDRLRRITDSAARSGVVIYTLDMRGLSTGFPDASADVAFDISGRLSRVNMGELSASQDALRTLAGDTGGRALLNTNALDKGLAKALDETSRYYLLAWKPDQSAGRREKFRRIKISIKDRPDLSVLVRNGFYEVPAEQPTTGRSKTKPKSKAAADLSPDEDLRAALDSLYPRRELPTSLSVGYVNVPKGGTVTTAAIEIDPEDAGLSAGDNTLSPGIDVLEVVLDDKGKSVSSFKDQLTFTPTNTAHIRHPAIYSRQFVLAPGLYEVRVAARDRKDGRTGSAVEWIEIPDIAGGKFALSSLYIGERKAGETGTNGDSAAPQQETPKPVESSVDHRFDRMSYLRFVTFIYNASRAGNLLPSVGLQVRITRDNKAILSTPLHKITVDGTADLARIPYAAEVPLKGLTPGRYLLKVTAVDLATKSSSTQQVDFVVK